MRIRTGDTVVVIAGKDSAKTGKKGAEHATGKVLRTYPKEDRILVDGINKVKKHKKPSQTNAEGSIVEQEAKIHISNVMLLDPKTKKPTRVGYKFEDGKKVRFAKQSGTIIDK